MNLGDEPESPWDDVPARPSSIHSNTRIGEQDQPDAPSSSTETPTNVAPAQTLATPTTSKTVKSPGGRKRPTPRFAAQPTKLEALDDDLGPLGPLGVTSAPVSEEEPPELPQKEQALPATRASRPSTASSQPSRAGEDGAGTGAVLHTRTASGDPVQDPSRRSTQPSAAIEQAAKPSFQIYVGDPHKVGGPTSSHTVYQLRTKTTSKAYRSSEFEVSRRYSDFLWLYNQLHSNNPGVIVPPPPEKQAVGRFDTNFVESRRAALEKMLNKIAAHPILQHDGDLKIFLESEAFNVDVKHREKKDPDMPAESSGGMFSKLNMSVGSGTKFIEHDDWFLERRVYLDTLEGQLKALLKATDTAVAQRKALADSSAELSASLNTLADVELAPSLTGPLASLSDLQLRIRDLYDRQAQQDVLTLGIVIDEYIRLIGSIKKAMEQRQRSWQNWHTTESDLQKRRSALDKLMRQGRSQQDKMSQLQADVGDAERRAHQARLQFEDIGKGMRGELERFEKEKVEDFRAGLETYLESAVEAQKELIELWETYLMHMDADEEEQQQQHQQQQHSQQQQSPLPPQQHTQHGHSDSVAERTAATENGAQEAAPSESPRISEATTEVEQEA